jgi:hypothetical protein
MVQTPPGTSPELPEVDERLVAPESRFEIEDGQVVYVPPADEPHGSTHAALAAVLMAHRGETYSVAVDMLTRTSRIDDIAPDASVYPSARNAAGGRQLEELAFEIASTETLAHAGKRAAKLLGRGVRRVFAIDVERGRAFEWSGALGTWSMLDARSQIADRALAVPMPVGALVEAARSDDAVARALRAKRHPEFVAERQVGVAEGRALGIAEGHAEGLAKAVVLVLEARGLALTESERRAIAAERDAARLARWIAAAASCPDAATLLRLD